MAKKPYLVGVTGGSASGKTHFLKSLKQKFTPQQVCFISQDDYYKPLEQQKKDSNDEVNFDLPEAIELSKFHDDLDALSRGETIKKMSYNFNNPSEEKELMDFSPTPIIIIEGLFIFYYQNIFDMLDLKLFIDADDDVKFQRRMKRDVDERGIAPDMVTYQWYNHVKPAFQKYLAPYKELADVVIKNNVHFNNSLAMVENHFKALLSE
ncbi:MAG: uridine kinase [bacterium]